MGIFSYEILNEIKLAENETYDYVSNTINNDLDFWKYSQNGFPNGFSVEVYGYFLITFSMNFL
mgnify:CR=1 FL=1